MEGVNVLTIRAAAAELKERRESVALRLARKELTAATINGRPAVLDDVTFRRMQRKVRRAAA